MDYPVISRTDEPGAAGVVVWANHYQFGAGEVVANRLVESRALICCDAGVGTIQSCGQTIDFAPSAWAFLPWRHDVTYRASTHDPFMVTAIHLIPWHDSTVPVQLHAAHGRRDPLAGVPYRRDIDWPDLRGLIRRAGLPGDRLHTMAELTVNHLQHGLPSTTSLRALSVLVISGLRSALTVPNESGPDVPPLLARMHEYVASHIQQPMTVRQIATAGGMSDSSAERLFRRYTGKSVGRWLTAKRLSVARDLLRTSNSSVAQVALATGFDDPSYFSRVFSRAEGLSPGVYAARSRLT